MSEFGPETITLVPQKTVRNQDEAMAKARAELSRLGFVEIGIYRVRQMPGLLLVAFAHASEPLVACVYDYSLAGVWCDVVATYADGKSLTVTNSFSAGLVKSPPWSTQVVLRGKGEKALFLAARKRLRAGAAVVVNRTTFPGMFEDAYRREMAWRNGRGVTQEEVRRVAKTSVEKFGEETIRATVKHINRKSDSPRAEDLPSGRIPSPVDMEMPAFALAQNEIFPIDVSAETGDMKKAIARAQSTLPHFLDRLASPRKGEREFLVRVRVVRKGKAFYLWLAKPTLTGRRCSGITAHAAEWLGYPQGKRLSVPADDLTDWAYREGKLWRGHHTCASLLRRMERATSKFEAHLEAKRRRTERALAKAIANPRSRR